MAFKSLFNYEADEAEAARLADSPEGSTNHDLSKLPVTNPYPGLPGNRLVRLPLTDIIGLLRHDGRKPEFIANPDGTLQHSGSYYLTVLGGHSDTYQVGGYDICVTEAEARRSQIISPEMLNSLVESTDGTGRDGGGQ